MNKRVHQIAKEHGVTAKELLERLHAAGVEVKAASSNVDEEVALRVLGNGQPSAAETTRTDGSGKAAKAKPAARKTAAAKPKAAPAAESRPAARAGRKPGARA